MTEYKCFNCHKNVAANYIKKKVRCIYCGYKIIFKTRSQPSVVKAR